MSETIIPLGRLTKVDLRTYWKNEGTEFTPWLSQEENIQLLSETIGIELQVQRQEENIGPFRADILCRDTVSDHFVLIENQLERTDHTHLGQLLTYAAGLDAVSIIWISPKFTEEHRAALDWLNRITDATFNFFGIEIELYKIGDSVPAPMFNLISKPNDWAKSVKKAAVSQNITDTKLFQQEYWQSLKNFLDTNRSPVKMQNAQPQHWANVAVGKSDFNITAQVNSRENVLTVMLNILGNDAKSNYEKLYEMAYDGSISEISENIIWDKMESKKMSCIYLTTSGDFLNKSEMSVQFAWFKEYLEKFTKYFKPFIRKI